MQENDAFLETAKVFDFYYGTPKKPIEEALSSGKDILFDIDWQGTQQLMNSLQDDLIKVFVFAPICKRIRKTIIKKKSRL